MNLCCGSAAPRWPDGSLTSSTACPTQTESLEPSHYALCTELNTLPNALWVDHGPFLIRAENKRVFINLTDSHSHESWLIIWLISHVINMWEQMLHACLVSFKVSKWYCSQYCKYVCIMQDLRLVKSLLNSALSCHVHITSLRKFMESLHFTFLQISEHIKHFNTTVTE